MPPDSWPMDHNFLIFGWNRDKACRLGSFALRIWCQVRVAWSIVHCLGLSLLQCVLGSTGIVRHMVSPVYDVVSQNPFGHLTGTCVDLV